MIRYQFKSLLDATRTLAAGALLFAGAHLAVAHAQSAVPEPPPAGTAADPQNPASTVPAIAYRSAFAGYRAFTAEKAQPWRDSNDTVGRIGGWRVYARESQPAAQPAPQAAPVAPGAAAVPPHGARIADPAPHKHPVTP